MHTHGGLPAVMVALYSRNPDRLLLVKDLRAPTKCWKFIGEEMELGELPPDTVIRALWEEGGFLARPDDPELSIAEVRPPITVQGLRLHLQYFYKVRLPYLRLRDLAGKKFEGKPDEFFKTQIFSFDDVRDMPSFFKLHRQLLKEFLGFAA